MEANAVLFLSVEHFLSFIIASFPDLNPAKFHAMFSEKAVCPIVFLHLCLLSCLHMYWYSPVWQLQFYAGI